jgi:4-diphosphocytidyl-2-C-methyl-D-erythritol kinase
MTTVTVPAFAKINLYLHVLGRRADGYHLLDSLVIFAGIGDTISVEPSDRLSLQIDGPFAAAVPEGPENLVLRAAEALAQGAGVRAQGAIRLTKRLPPASGIGSGSADAAATLRALARLWRLAPADDDLSAVGLTLGADVPVCLFDRAAFVGGIGERIDAAPRLPPFWLVLANPGVAVPTPAVFRSRTGPFSSPGRFIEAPAAPAAFAGLLAMRRNDLGPPAEAIAPAIRETVTALARLPGALLARMSGSGATVVALFAERDQAETGAESLRKARPRWWVAAAPVAAPSFCD